MDDSSRILAIERDIADLRDRMGSVESSAKGAWKTINEVNGRMDKIETEVTALKTTVNSMEKDVKQLKLETSETTKAIKILIKVVAGLCGVVALYFFYSIKSGSDLPEKIVETILPLIGK